MSSSAEPIVTETPVDATVVAENTPGQEPKKKRTVFVHPKTQKQLDALKAKQDKLVNDNKALKQQLSDIKASHSRIRRIPKVPAPEQQA